MTAVLRDLSDAAEPRIVHCGTDEPRVIDDACEVLAGDPYVFQRAGTLTHIVTEIRVAETKIARPPSAPRIVQLPSARLRERLAATATWKTYDARKKKWTECHPPAWVVAGVEARGEWVGIALLEGVVETPVLRRDGTILDQEGYDQTTGLVFKPTGEFLKTPDLPTQADARAAAEELLDVVSDFPFATPAHRSAWLAGVLTPFARFAFHGPSPLFLIDANVRGSGKSLLADTIGAICAGREMARATKPDTDDEWGKVITSIALAGDTMVLLDNLTGTLGSGKLDAALTGTEWADRILGSNERPRLPLLATWYATGNNVTLAGDTARRAVHIRIESPDEQPEQRTGFRHPEILRWIRSERPRLARAALVMLRALFLADRRPEVAPWGSYEAWSRVVRAAVVYAGQPDPIETVAALRETADSDSAVLEGLLTAWAEADSSGEGLIVGEVLRRLAADPNLWPNLRTALATTFSVPPGQLPPASKVGYRLRSFRGRWCKGMCFEQGPVLHGQRRWTVRRRGSDGPSVAIPPTQQLDLVGGDGAIGIDLPYPARKVSLTLSDSASGDRHLSTDRNPGDPVASSDLFDDSIYGEDGQ